MPEQPSAADERRSEILTQAAALFDERGYFGTNLEDVAASVGLRKASLYHYFRGKTEILASIHEDFLTWSVEREERRRAYGLPAGQHLLEIISDTLEVLAQRPGHVRVFIEHYRELDPPTRQRVAAERERYTRTVEEVIREGIESAQLRPMDPQLAVLALFGACNWAYRWYGSESTDPPRDTAYALWDILMRGIDRLGAGRATAQNAS